LTRTVKTLLTVVSTPVNIAAVTRDHVYKGEHMTERDINATLLERIPG